MAIGRRNRQLPVATPPEEETMQTMIDHREISRRLTAEGHDQADIDAALDSMIQAGEMTYADEDELYLTEAELDVVRAQLESETAAEYKRQAEAERREREEEQMQTYQIPDQTTDELATNPTIGSAARTLHERAINLIRPHGVISEMELWEELAAQSGLPGAGGYALAAVAVVQLERERRIESTKSGRSWRLTGEEKARIRSRDLYDSALARVRRTPELEPHEAFILADWEQGDEHLLWVLVAPIDEILGWIQDDFDNPA